MGAENMFILSHHPLNIGATFGRLLPAQPCYLCGELTHDGLCCTACQADLPHHTAPCCTVCALPLPVTGVCGRCLAAPPAFAHTIAAFRYAFPLDHMIRALKFDECLILADFLADALAARIDERADLLIPLPLHPARLRERGFNQSHLLATRLSRILHMPLLAQAATRVRDTLPQSSLPWRERGKNMQHAFALAAGTDVHGKHVAIVDDVMTTGASIEALARILKQAGAKKVSAWVVARTFPGRASQEPVGLARS